MNQKMLVVLYVDDGLIAADRQCDIDEFLIALRTRFKITESGVSNFLGMQIKVLPDGSIFVNQENYAKRVLDKFNMLECNAVSTPMEKCQLSPDERNVACDSTVPYRAAAGSLLYLTTITRPDLAFAVSNVCKHLEKPSVSNWNDVKRIFKYLKDTTNLGILYQASHPGGELHVFSDADYAGCAETRKSTTGVAAMYAAGAIAWQSQRQGCVSLSSTEAEFVAAAEGAKLASWLHRLMSEITVINSVPTLFVDNLSAVKLIQNPVFHKRSKHIDVRYYYVRNEVSMGNLLVKHVCSEKQLADLLTKPLVVKRLVANRIGLGMISESSGSAKPRGFAGLCQEAPGASGGQCVETAAHCAGLEALWASCRADPTPIPVNCYDFCESCKLYKVNCKCTFVVNDVIFKKCKIDPDYVCSESYCEFNCHMKGNPSNRLPLCRFVCRCAVCLEQVAQASHCTGPTVKSKPQRSRVEPCSRAVTRGDNNSGGSWGVDAELIRSEPIRSQWGPRLVPQRCQGESGRRNPVPSWDPSFDNKCQIPNCISCGNSSS